MRPTWFKTNPPSENGGLTCLGDTFEWEVGSSSDGFQITNFPFQIKDLEESCFRNDAEGLARPSKIDHVIPDASRAQNAKAFWL